MSSLRLAEASLRSTVVVRTHSCRPSAFIVAAFERDHFSRLSLGYATADLPRSTSYLTRGVRLSRISLSMVTGPIAAAVFLSTLGLSRGSFRGSVLLALVPFLIGCLLSIPLFRPETPHGNITFVGAVWLALGTMTVWIHSSPQPQAAIATSIAPIEAKMGYIKELIAMWKGLVVGLLAAYIGLLVSLTKELHLNNETLVRVARERFILDRYTDVQLVIVSLFVLTGPIYEAALKALSSSRLLLSLSPPDR